jgi:hypothetical protein
MKFRGDILLGLLIVYIQGLSMDYCILWVRLDPNNLHPAITRYKGQNLLFMGSGNF